MRVWKHLWLYLLLAVLGPTTGFGQSIELTLDQRRGGGDSLIVDVYIQLVGGSPFVLGPSNFAFRASKGVVDYSAKQILSTGPWGSTLYPSEYDTLRIGGDTIVNLTLTPKSIPEPTNPVFLVTNTPKLVASVYIPVLGCTDSVSVAWLNSGVVTRWGIVFLTSINRVNPPQALENPPVELLISPSADTTVCLGTTLLLTATTAVDWTVDATPEATGVSTLSYTFNTLGAIDVEVNLGTCTDLVTVTVVDTPSLQIPSADTTVCLGTTLLLTATTAVDWTVDATPEATGVSTLSYTFNTLGAIDVEVKNANGCVDNVTVTVTAPVAIVSPTTHQSLCAGSSLTLTANSVTDWFVLNGGVAPVASSVLNYIHTVGNSGVDTILAGIAGCYDTLFVNIFNKPVIQIPSIDTAVCLGATSTFTSSIAGNWTWITQAGVSTPVGIASTSSIPVTFAAPGVDTVIVATLDGCLDTVLVTINASLSISNPTAVDTTLCQNSVVTLTSTGPGNWTVLNGGFATNIGNATPSVPYSFSNIGIDTIIVSAGVGCEDTVFVTVLANPAFSGPSVVAGGASGVIYSAVTAVSWQLRSSIGSVIPASNPTQLTVNFGSAATPSIDTIIATAGLCSDTLLVNVSAALCTALAGNVSNDTIVCVGTGSVVYLEGFSGDAILWQDSSSVSGVWSDVVAGIGFNAQVYLTDVLTDTTYFRAIVSTSICSDTSATIRVAVVPRPVSDLVTPSMSAVCVGETVTLTLGVNAGQTFQWEQSANALVWQPVVGGSDPTVSVYTTAPLAAATYYRVRISTPCADSFSNPVFVDVIGMPVGSFAVAPAAICPNSRTLPLGATVISGTGIWSSTGQGGFTDPTNPNARYVADSLDAGNTIDLIWTVSSGSCGTVQYVQPLTIQMAPRGSVNNVPSAICAGDTTIVLNATVQSGTGRWATPNGLGAFEDVNNPNTRYISVAGDANQVIVLWWIVENSTCVSDTTQVYMLVSQPPLGSFPVAPAPVCIGGTTAPLGATLSQGLGFWSTSGLGVFTDPSNPNSQYIATEAGQDSVLLTWVVISGNCAPEVYNQRIYVYAEPLGSFATVLDTICSGGTTIPLNGVATVGTGHWGTSNGLGTFTPNIFTPNARYHADTSDAGQNILLHWIVSNGPCVPDTTTQSIFVRSDRVFGTFSTPPADICANEFSQPLGATVIYGTGNWFTPDGTGFFEDVTDPNTRYRPGPGVNDRTITLVWRVTNGDCAALELAHPLSIFVEPQGIFPLGPDPICVGDATGPLNAATLRGVGEWRAVNGGGTFVPNAQSPTARYASVAADAGKTLSMEWIITNGVCKPDTLRRPLQVNTPPAGSFTTNIPDICAGSPTLPLNASVSSGLVEWSSPNCDGTFSPPDSPNAIYNSVLTDAGKSCVLRLRIFNPGCTDTVMTRNVTVLNTIVAGTFTPAPAPVCIGDTTAPLGATVTSGTGTWQTSGTGTFIPNITDPNARYIPGAGDAGTTVTLTWQITNGLCNALLRPQPLVVSANPSGSIQSPSTTLCFPSTSDTLQATAIVGTGRWDTDGDGAINVVSPTQAIYVPVVTDLGSVVNMFWITESGVCKADTQTIALTYDTPPIGSFVTNLAPMCAGSQTPPLGATLQLGIGRWEASSGRGTFLNINDPNTIYISDTLDAGDTIRLHWIISNGSTCAEDTNRRQLVLLDTKIEGDFSTAPAPVCQGTLTQPLGATVSIGRGSWSTSGNGVFLPNDTTPNAQYLPIGDAGSTVNLCWTIRDDFGFCAVRQLCQPLIVNPAPAGGQVNVPVSSICIGDSTEPYLATVSVGQGFWSCLNCSGTFTQPDSLTTRYSSGPADTGVVVTIRWSVTNLGCDTVHYDRQLVVFNTSLGAFGNAPDTICAGDASMPLGAETIRGIGQWNCTNCNGGFTAPTSNPNARYISVLADSAQDVVLEWIVRNGVCDSVVYQQTLHVLAPSLGAFNTIIAPVCEGQASAPLNAEAINGTGFWSTNGTGTFSDLTSATATYTPGVGDGGTSLQLTWTVTNGVCNPRSYSRNMTVFAPSEGFFPPIEPDSICVGDSTLRLAAGTVFGVGSWSTPNGAGTFTSATDPNARYISTALDANTPVILRWTVVNGTCDPISYEDTVFVVGARVVNAGADRVLCIGDTLQLNASGTDFYVWSPAATLDNPNSPTPRAFPDVTTTYTVTGFDNVLNCVTVDTIRVDVITGTLIQITSNDLEDPNNPRICEGNEVRLIVSGAVSGYRWAPSTGLDDSTAASPIARPTETTTYRLVARTPNGCLSPTAQITVRVDPFPQPVFTSNTLCIGAAYEIPVFNTANCNESEVYNIDAQTVQLVAQQTGYGPAHPNYVTDRDTFVIVANDLGVLTYSYRCRNATTGCESFTEATFTIVNIPSVTVTADRYVVPYAEADTNAGIVNRQVRFNTTSPDSISFYYWEFNDPNSDTNIVINNPNPSHIFTGPGNYTVVLFVENEFGCPQLQVLDNFVTVLAEDFVFPTAFTPNADGLNDVFQALPAQTARVQRFEIYDRWGQRVFLGNDNRGWDGTDGSGRQLDPGLYTYRVLIEMDTRGSQLFTGYVTLIR